MISPRSLAATILGLTLTLAGASSPGASSGSASPQPIQPAIPVPANGAYFGAWVNPPGAVNEEGKTETLESQINRSLVLHMHYYGWGPAAACGASPSACTPPFPDGSMQEDRKKGRTPVVTWTCGDTNAIVAGGKDDALIDATAAAVKKFGKPVFLRWNWEMNLKTNSPKCLGTDTLQEAAYWYIRAWQHIHEHFAQNNVTNVVWLWNPGGAPGDPDPKPYYPGPNYVDWIGFDGYDKEHKEDFGAVFGHFYSEFSSYKKPFLIAETGECPETQDKYLDSAQAEIQGESNPGGYDFRMVKGFMYFDAPGNFRGCTWNFDNDGIKGFAQMGADPFFKP